ncbi:aminoglycoside 6-adenylyltransferase [Neobacillus cucumis]|uniref:aminoglycoside 6-adenylyltransferase n=1 Tax=Neobacillus cucumis TaxID=1740721 RepID=UPI00203E71AC|nr:aminoglycoside 6-adenylyltransferase [Neobacillus cucumis]MCM3727959.1 aminoglycoside 6-adenylyltransferase [Neobacillus cucumis]
MRTEKEMYELIMGIAQKDERIRAIYMNGSRTNPNAPKDIFQDYDMVFVVTETASFINEVNWIDIFGELIMIQEPDKMDQLAGKEADFDKSYGYLMLFQDGNRVDLHIETKEKMLENYKNDPLTKPLLDKDNILPSIPAPSDQDYWTKKPSEQGFLNDCNDFWWCLQNVAKGIWRDELPYAKQMFEMYIRPRLAKMAAWWIGMKHDFQVSPGKMGKYFKQYLPESYWGMYEQTYSDHDYEDFWDSIFVTCHLFRALAKEVADQLLFTYQDQDDINMTQYLQHIRQLPADAKSIF